MKNKLSFMKFPTIASLSGAPSRPIAALDVSNATCIGQFRFDTAHAGRGHSECTEGDGVDFSATSSDAVAPELVCNYTLAYDYSVKPQHGTGDIACDDGMAGKLSFERTGEHMGEATAAMSDGRKLRFTYTQ